MLLPQLPAIADGWVIRAGLDGEWDDVATSGPHNKRLELLTPDAPITVLTEADTFRLVGIPMYERHGP